MKTLYIVRHSKAEGQAFEAKLTSVGQEQSMKLAEFLSNKGINQIISSPYVRACETIQPLAERLDIKIIKDDRLSERVLSTVDLPDWMDRLNDTFDNLDISFEGGESSREAMERGLSAIRDILKSEERSTVVVTHGNLMALILKYYQPDFHFKEWKALSNPDVYVLEFSEETPEIKRIWSQ